jgi:hypothetical protein
MTNLRTCNKRRKRLRGRLVAILSAREPGKPWRRHKVLVTKGQPFSSTFPGTFSGNGWIEGHIEFRPRT